MRVITGTARGRKLFEPKNMDIRPTTDMVKESMFNIIQFDIEGRRVLDTFAGTGQLGIEALSRGAASVTFLDESPTSIKLIKQNLDHCKLTGEVLRENSLSYLKHARPFDLIFLDPPYGKGLENEAIDLIVKFDILSEGGIILVETKKETEIIPLVAPYEMTKVFNYGKIKLSIITKKGN